jgi:hypothetical protein
MTTLVGLATVVTADIIFSNGEIFVQETGGDF